jgi:hypothetical protein
LDRAGSIARSQYDDALLLKRTAAAEAASLAFAEKVAD